MSFDLPNSDSIQPDRVSAALLDDIRELARQVNELRPLSGGRVAAIHERLLGERVFNSNAMEGNTLTLRETLAVLRAGLIADMGRQREAAEVINLAASIRELQGLVALRDQWPDLAVLRSVHAILLRGIEPDAAGRFRGERVVITGARHQPPNVESMHRLLAGFERQFSSSLASGVDPVILATWVHWAIARIHPFCDGNGRIARLWQDLVLFGHGLTAAIIPARDRTRYYAVLSMADDGDFNPLLQLVAERVCSTLQVYIDVDRVGEAMPDWPDGSDWDWVVQEDNGERLEYARWCRVIESFRDCFRQQVEKFRFIFNGRPNIEMTAFEVIDQPMWRALRQRTIAATPWFFRVDFFVADAGAGYVFCFAENRLAASAAGPQSAFSGPALCVLETPVIFMSHRMEVPSPGALPFSALRVAGSKLAGIWLDWATGNETVERDLEPVTVADRFLTSVCQRFVR